MIVLKQTEFTSQEDFSTVVDTKGYMVNDGSKSLSYVINYLHVWKYKSRSEPSERDQ